MSETFNELLEDLPEGYEATPFTDANVARVTYAGRDIAVITPEADPDKVYFRTTVTNAEGCDRARLTRELLRGNAFWQGASGAILSLADNQVYLTDRRALDAFDDSDTLAEYLANLVAAAILWNERVDLTRTPAKEA